METIVVTGGTGYLGSKLCLRLEASGHDVVIWDINSEEGVDLSDFNSLKKAAYSLGSKSFTLIHLAFPLPGTMTSRKMIENIRKVNSNITKLLKPTRTLFISSTAVYNTQMDRVEPWEIYGKLKLETETALADLNLSVFRPGTLVSAERDSSIAKLYKGVLSGAPLPLPEKGKLIHPFCDVSDLVNAICDWVINGGDTQSISNIYATNPLSVAEFLNSKKLANRSFSLPNWVSLSLGWDVFPIFGVSRWHFRALRYDITPNKLLEIENLGSVKMAKVFESLLTR